MVGKALSNSCFDKYLILLLLWEGYNKHVDLQFTQRSIVILTQ